MAYGYDLLYNYERLHSGDRRALRENSFIRSLRLRSNSGDGVRTASSGTICLRAVGFLYGDRRLIDFA